MRTIISRLPRYAPAFLSSKTPIITSRAFTMSSTIYSSNTSAPAEETEPQPQSQNNTSQAPLALPASESNTNTFDMSNGNTTVSLDHLGPMVVNVDGTMSRISNWDKMAEIEKTATLRIIGKRNKMRLEALKKAGEQGEGVNK